MTPIYRWSGEYFGFLSGGNLFDASCRYLGWAAADGEVWRKDGSLLGEIVEDNYILRNTMTVARPLQPIRPIPVIPPTPARWAIRTARALRTAYVDALAEFPDA
jgi:hypothetical protein